MYQHIYKNYELPFLPCYDTDILCRKELAVQTVPQTTSLKMTRYTKIEEKNYTAELASMQF